MSMKLLLDLHREMDQIAELRVSGRDAMESGCCEQMNSLALSVSAFPETCSSVF